VAVAVKIVALPADEKTARASENSAVNTMTSPMRTSMLWMKNSTNTVVVGKADERTVTMTVLIREIFFSE
jgi:hypothetical protein